MKILSLAFFILSFLLGKNSNANLCNFLFRANNNEIEVKGNQDLASMVLLQGFHWESHKLDWYRILAELSPEIGRAGFNAIWLPPPSNSHKDAPQGYMPRELYDLNSAYGSQRDLIKAIFALQENKLHVLADIVINHRVGSHDWADFKNPEWGPEAVAKGDTWDGARGNSKKGTYFEPARNLDHSQKFVRDDIIAWIQWLKNEIGFDGLRFDFVRGYDPKYIQQYVKATHPVISIGEYWVDYYPHDIPGNRQAITDWIDRAGQVSYAFDTTTKAAFDEAFKRNDLTYLVDNGKPMGLINWFPHRAITFVDNHDTGSTQQHWPIPGPKVLQMYAYILTHPGIPCVFWEHYFDWGAHHSDQIGKMIQLRKNRKIHSTSYVDIVGSTKSLYAAYIDGDIAIKLGTQEWSPEGEGWKLLINGSEFAIWGK